MFTTKTIYLSIQSWCRKIRKQSICLAKQMSVLQVLNIAGLLFYTIYSMLALCTLTQAPVESDSFIQVNALVLIYPDFEKLADTVCAGYESIQKIRSFAKSNGGRHCTLLHCVSIYMMFSIHARTLLYSKPVCLCLSVSLSHSHAQSYTPSQ